MCFLYLYSPKNESKNLVRFVRGWSSTHYQTPAIYCIRTTRYAPGKKYFKYFESQDTALRFCIVISPTLLSSKVLLCIFLVLTYSHGNIISENLHGNVNLQLNRRVMKRAAGAHNFAVVLWLSRVESLPSSTDKPAFDPLREHLTPKPNLQSLPVSAWIRITTTEPEFEVFTDGKFSAEKFHLVSSNRQLVTESFAAN